jgi:hypothetical protein
MSCPKAGRDTCTLVSVWGEPEMLVNNDGDGFWFASAYGEATCECSCVAGIQCRR